MMPTFSALPPSVVVLSLGTMVLMLAITIKRSEIIDAVLTLLTLLVALAVLPMGAAPSALFAVDDWHRFSSALIILSSIGVLAMSWRDPTVREAHAPDEFYLLLLMSALGAVLMTAGRNDITFFIGLETLSLSLLGLIGYRQHRIEAGEAAMKYVVLSGVSSAILVFGFALSYAETGSLVFAAPHALHPVEPLLAAMATVLVMTGMFFKLSAVPFHTWLADVLEGTSIPVAALLSVVSKIGLFAAMLRYFAGFDLMTPGSVSDEVTAVALLSMIGGNLLAIGQTDLKRMLAGSSIAHIGYLMVALLAPGAFGLGSAGFYLAAYAAATIGAFAIMEAVSPNHTHLNSLQGLFRTRPALALGMAVMMASLAGIPPAVGFFAKVYVAVAGVSAHRDLLLAGLIVGSVMGLFYYLRVVRVMLMPATDEASTGRIAAPGNAVLISALALVTLVLGVYPSLLIPRNPIHLGADVEAAALPVSTQTAIR
jgi:NADH-quinone oxidoreductase subunit N